MVKRKILLISDLHLDDISKNNHRWGIFQQIKQKIKENDISSVYILGDLTDKKDYHSSKFVNRLVFNLQNIADQVSLTILAGNHDYVDENSPFFHFLSELDSGIKYISGVATEGQTDEIFIPHVKNPEDLYKDIDFSKYNICFTHIDVKAARLENGMKDMKGIPLSFFKGTLTFSGHIHVGQQIGKNFHYIGSPYSIIYERQDILHRGIILTYENDKSISFEDVYFNFPRKIVRKINSIDSVKNVDKNNFYKFDIGLSRPELDNYNQIKHDVQDNDNIILNLKLVTENNEVITLNKSDYFKSYCKSNDLSEEIIKIGKELIA